VNASKSNTENQKTSCQNSTASSPVTSHGNTNRNYVKQEAKVKGIPKESVSNPEMRRQQSVPVYDRPPRLQSHGNSISSRHNDGSGYSGYHNTPGQPLEGFPTVTILPKPEPPRAIILPEVKQNPGNQFGPIGSRGGAGSNVLHKSTWQDSPAAPSPGQTRHHHQAMHGPSVGLIPPPGLTIMQQLQAERRQREEEYARRQNNWPGFGDRSEVVGNSAHLGIQPNNYVESLWDSQPGMRGEGMGGAGGPQQAAGHAMQVSQQGLWGTIGNVWPSTVFNSGFNYTEGQEQGNVNTEKEGEALGFDSLSLSSIWSSGGAGGGQPPEADANSWSSLFNNNNKKDM